jgi:integral membrane sensor domain MASE1
LSWSRLLAANLAFALLYGVSGRFGIGLAPPAGFASPFFPPAGVALAFFVVYGVRVLPGMVAGALALNIAIAADVAHALSPKSVTLACIGTAACAVQGLFGAWMCRRWVRPSLGAGRDVLRFLLIAPVVATLSASFGLAAFALFGVGGDQPLAVSWPSWWMGDTVGILLAAPLCWIMIGQPRELWARRRWTVALPLLLSATVFILIYQQARGWERRQQAQAFELAAQRAGDRLQARFAEY